MARMRPVLFSNTSAAPCTVGRTRQLRYRTSRDVGRAPILDCAFAGIRPGLDHLDVNDIIEAELVSDVPCKAGQGHDTAVGKTNADHAFVVLAAALLHDHRRYPMHVVEWQMSSLQRLLPRWRTRLLVELLNYVSEIRFRAMKLDMASRKLVSRQPFLQRRFSVALQLRVDS